MFEKCSNLKIAEFGSKCKNVSIDYGLFYYCEELEKVVLPTSMKNRSDCVFDYFSGCINLKELTMPQQINNTDIMHCFYNCKSLVEIYIPEGIKTIYDSTFNGCSSLKIIHIPKSLTAFLDQSLDKEEIQIYAYKGSYGEKLACEKKWNYIQQEGV